MNLFKKIIFTILLSLVLNTFHFTPAQAIGSPIGNRQCATGNLIGNSGDPDDGLDSNTYFVAQIGSSYKVSGGSGCVGNVIITSGVTTIGDYAFENNKLLTSVTIPNTVTTIGDYAFYYTTSLTSVTIGNSVTSIGYLAFYGNTSLTYITIPNSVTTISSGAFANNT